MPSSLSSNAAAAQLLTAKEGGRLIVRGEVVAFPTETVFGLGADARNSAAVAKIFSLKGRPSSNPLIVHIPDVSKISDVANLSLLSADAQARVQRLVSLWPGPLTIVLPKRESICAEVTAGGALVGVRVPAQDTARDFLLAADCPVAAPSANRSNRISPTEVAHVHAEFGGRVAIVDGPASTLGLESTVVEPTNSGTIIHRPGYVTAELIDSLAGPIISPSLPASALVSPGQLALHYAPNTPTFLYSRIRSDVRNVGVLGLTADVEQTKDDTRVAVRTPFTNIQEYAAQLYRTLRTYDDGSLSAIAIIPPPALGLGIAICDRINRATASPRL